VDWARNISSVVENKLTNQHKIRENAIFFFAKKLRENVKKVIYIPF